MPVVNINISINKTKPHAIQSNNIANLSWKNTDRQVLDLNALGKNRNSLFTALLQTDRLRNDRSFGHHDDSKMFGLFLFTCGTEVMEL